VADAIDVYAFEVPASGDDAFLALWDAARAFLADRRAFAATRLHRALRDDVDLRFVNVARIPSPDAWRRAVGDPAFPGARVPFAAHRGLYEVVHESGTADGAGGVVLINFFEVPGGEDDAFMSGWTGARERLETQQGYLGTRPHRSVGPADFRYVDLARWSSPLMFARAMQRPEVQAATGALPFRGRPALYEVLGT